MGNITTGFTEWSMLFSAKCSERNGLYDRGQCMNTAVHCFATNKVNYSKSVLTSTS